MRNLRKSDQSKSQFLLLGTESLQMEFERLIQVSLSYNHNTRVSHFLKLQGILFCKKSRCKVLPPRAFERDTDTLLFLKCNDFLVYHSIHDGHTTKVTLLLKLHDVPMVYELSVSSPPPYWLNFDSEIFINGISV